MESRFSVHSSILSPSKTELVIGGLKTYIYGLDEVKQQGYLDIAVLYHVHRREWDYRDGEEFAHEVLHQYRSDGPPKKAGLILVTFDARNHGERKVR